jgi:hypothetical protein
MNKAKGFIVVGIFAIMASLFPYVNYTGQAKAKLYYESAQSIAQKESDEKNRVAALREVETHRRQYDDGSINNNRSGFVALSTLGAILIASGLCLSRQKNDKRDHNNRVEDI